MSYPVKMREKAIEALKKGKSRKEITELFGLGQHTLRDWENLLEETGSLENRTLNRKPRKIDREELRKYCQENPFATHKEAAVHFNCNESGIRHAKKALGITRKKDNTIHRKR
jgi:transposase